MSEENASNLEENGAAATEEAHEAVEDNLFDHDLENFYALAQEDLEKALERYGFAFLHSVPPARRVRMLQKIGLLVDNPWDHYNLGTACAENEEYEEAAKYLQKAIEAKPEFTNAYYNLALCQEKMGRIDDARGTWNDFLSRCEREEDVARVKAHLEEL